MLAEMLAAGLNANLGGRDHAGIEVERQIVQLGARRCSLFRTAAAAFSSPARPWPIFWPFWWRPHQSYGHRGAPGRARQGRRPPAGLCLRRSTRLRAAGDGIWRVWAPMPCATGRPDILPHGCGRAAGPHRAATEGGAGPFLVVGSAGTVDVGAIDDLDAIAALCARGRILVSYRRRLWRAGHAVAGDGAALKGIDTRRIRSPSISTNGVRCPTTPVFCWCATAAAALDTFASPAAYLRREARGLAAGSPWPCDFGPDLSRGFRALKTWFTLKSFGGEASGRR